MQTIQERRKAPRAASRVPVDIYDPKGRAVVGEGRCIDLSILGARMFSRKPLKARTPVRIQLVPTGKPVLEIPGKVVWSRKKTSGFEYGICFSGKPLQP